MTDILSPTDADLRLSLEALRLMLAEDRAAGRRPLCVVANAGTTNTGAVDPLPELAELCAAEDLWLHVDGAYGAAAVLTGRGRQALQGLERADSITLDPHKWLFQPYEIGCLLVRNAGSLRLAFRVDDDDHADYLQDVTRHVQDEVNFYEMGPQLSRRPDSQAGKNVNASVCGTANSITSCAAAVWARSMARVLCSACSISSDWSYSVWPAGVRRVG